MLETTLPLTYIGTYDNIKVGYASNVVAGTYITRDSLSDMIHSGGNPEQHPEYSFIVKNQNKNHFVKGSWELWWEWAPGQYTEEQIDTYIGICSINRPGLSLSKDMANNKVIATLSEASIEISEPSQFHLPWSLSTDIAGIKALSDGGEIFCCTFVNGTYNTYTIDSLSVEPNSTKEVAKAGELCYIFTTEDLTSTNAVPIQKYTAYKLMYSVSKEFTNSSLDTRARIFRIYN